MRCVKLWAVAGLSVAVAAASFAEPPKEEPKSKPRQTAKSKPKPKSKPKSATSKPAKKDEAEKPARNRAVKAMKMVVENAEFEEMPLEDFVEWLERLTQASVVVRWKVLETAGIEKDRPITLKQKNIPLGKLLPQVFEELTRELEDVQLAAKADGNVLLITTRADLNSRLVTRNYDIEAFRIVVPDFKGRQPNLDHVGQGGRSGGGALQGGGGNGQQGPGIDAETQKLIDAITSMIDPPSWKVNGGKGTITEFKGQLIIRNSEEAHEAINALLGGQAPAVRSKAP